MCVSHGFRPKRVASYAAARSAAQRAIDRRLGEVRVFDYLFTARDG